jgi:hypothetical protein
LLNGIEAFRTANLTADVDRIHEDRFGVQNLKCKLPRNFYWESEVKVGKNNRENLGKTICSSKRK